MTTTKKEKTDMKAVPLGTKMRDKITGFEGVAIAKVEHLNGCVQYYLKPKLDKDGKLVDAGVFDCQQLEIVQEPPKSDPKKPTGGVMPDTQTGGSRLRL